MGFATDRFILLGAAHGVVIDDHKSITEGSVFLYEHETELQNILLEAYSEMAFVVNRFQSAHMDILKNGTPELANYLSQINDVSLNIPPEAIIELHAFDLSTYFKTFLLLAKGALDKLVPLYSYRYYDTIKQFSSKGSRLIKAINNNKRVSRPQDFVALIEKNKKDWIDTLVDLRNDYAHYSSLPAYQNFTLLGERANKKGLFSISDFTPPLIVINGVSIDALDYMLSVKNQMVDFFRQFLLLCEFTQGRRPKHYLSCECGHEFAKQQKSGMNAGKLKLTSGPLEMKIKDRKLDYAVIICPKCNRTTDTDLKFWQNKGLIQSASG